MVIWKRMGAWVWRKGASRGGGDNMHGSTFGALRGKLLPVEFAFFSLLAWQRVFAQRNFLACPFPFLPTNSKSACSCQLTVRATLPAYRPGSEHGICNRGCGRVLVWGNDQPCSGHDHRRNKGMLLVLIRELWASGSGCKGTLLLLICGLRASGCGYWETSGSAICCVD